MARECLAEHLKADSILTHRLRNTSLHNAPLLSEVLIITGYFKNVYNEGCLYCNDGNINVFDLTESNFENISS